MQRSLMVSIWNFSWTLSFFGPLDIAVTRSNFRLTFNQLLIIVAPSYLACGFYATIRNGPYWKIFRFQIFSIRICRLKSRTSANFLATRPNFRLTFNQHIIIAAPLYFACGFYATILMGPYRKIFIFQIFSIWFRCLKSCTYAHFCHWVISIPHREGFFYIKSLLL